MKSARIAIRPLITAGSLALFLGIGMIHAPALAAKKDPPQSWDAKVRPIFEQYCFGCHGSETQMAGLRLDRREAALQGGESGPVIIANSLPKVC